MGANRTLAQLELWAHSKVKRSWPGANRDRGFWRNFHSSRVKITQSCRCRRGGWNFRYLRFFFHDGQLHVSSWLVLAARRLWLLHQTYLKVVCAWTRVWGGKKKIIKHLYRRSSSVDEICGPFIIGHVTCMTNFRFDFGVWRGSVWSVVTRNWWPPSLTETVKMELGKTLPGLMKMWKVIFEILIHPKRYFFMSLNDSE